ncbi:MAG: chromosome segregation protein SMC [Clostridia bacterium]|nr:chromosome segregation protein SMC [Clostridia bacterium]
MNFKQIEMVGFKSFADPIKLVLQPGINAIVGPNGCGKSNVADAIKWVLGEQSSKNLRGDSMQDVIFKGTEKRKGTAYCEVSLCFDNTNKLFNTPFEEFTITRKLYKNGDSEYMLNNTPCRLKQIVEILHNTGVGKGGYSIISQGMVSKILQSKPEERRVIFEEAAGIAAYKAKKVDAERRLERTQANLDNIQNILTEIDRQLTPLKKQSETAKIYLKLKEELKILEVNAYIYQYDYASENKEIIQAKIDAILKELNIRQKTLDEIVEKYNNDFDKLNNLDTDVKAVHDKILDLTVQLEKQFGQSSLVREKIKNLVSEVARVEEIIKANEEKISETNKVIYNCKNNKIAKENSLFVERNQLDEYEHAYSEVVNELQIGEEEAYDMQKSLFDSLDKLSDVKAKVSALNVEKQNYSSTLDLALADKNEYNKRLFEIKDLEEKSLEKLQNLSKSKKELELQVSHFVQQQNNLLGNVKVLESRLSECNNDKISLKQHLNIYENMQKEYEGFAGAVKKLLKDAEYNIELKKRIVGVVANLIKVPEKYQTAIEMALGNAVQNIVTQSDEYAKYLINYLKQREYGRITFLPLNSVKSRSFDARYNNYLNNNGVYGIASQLIEYDKEITPVISSLLGTTVIVNNADTAVNLAKLSGYSFRIVTLDGDIISTQGSITGGSRKVQGTNILSRETEIEDTKRRLVKLESEYQSLSTQLAEKQSEYLNITNKIKELTDSVHNLEIDFAKENEAYSNYNSKKTGLQDEINKIDSNIGKCNQMLQSINNELLKFQTTEGEISEQKNNFGQNQNDFAVLKAKRDELLSNITESKIGIGKIESEISAINSELDRLNVEVGRLTHENVELTKQYNLNKVMLSEYEKSSNISILESQNSEKEAEINAAKAELKTLEESKASLQADLRYYDEERLRLIDEVNKLQDKKYQQDLNLTKVDTDIEAMQERVWEEYELTYASALQFKQEVFDVKNGLQEINRVKRQIQGLGNININAIEDYKLLEARHGNMYEQAQDLLKAEADIKEIIKSLSDEMTEIFVTEFNKINENFGVIFKELFGGGRASLQLLDAPSVLDAGVEIIAVPPEKKLNSTKLLSGGEQALVAIAILFAILKLKPMPFCLLDEIEAPLDEANVYRFVQYLKKYAGETQFIVITHKKPTMEYADCLFGITMEEKGVSKVVSVKLSDAVKMAEVK